MKCPLCKVEYLEHRRVMVEDNYGRLVEHDQLSCPEKDWASGKIRSHYVRQTPVQR